MYEAAYDMIDIKRAVDKCSTKVLVEEKERIIREEPESMIKTTTIMYIESELKWRKGEKRM